MESKLGAQMQYISNTIFSIQLVQQSNSQNLSRASMNSRSLLTDDLIKHRMNECTMEKMLLINDGRDRGFDL